LEEYSVVVLPEIALAVGCLRGKGGGTRTRLHFSHQVWIAIFPERIIFENNLHIVRKLLIEMVGYSRERTACWTLKAAEND